MPPLIPDFDLYRELEVREDASIETIEAAWRSLAKRNHPDSAPAGSSASRMTRINVAHDWLTNADRRSQYDQIRSRTPPVHQPSSAPTEPGYGAPTYDTRGPTRTTPSPHPASPSSSERARNDNKVESVQAVFRKLELADRPLAYAKSRVPIIWIGGTALYTAIFAGATVGLTAEMTSGNRTVTSSILILLILVALTAAGVAMLVGFAYFYYSAVRLHRQRGQANRSN